MGFNIFLNQYKKKKGEKKALMLPVDLEQEAKTFVQEFQEGDLSQVDLYNRERNECTKVRLNINIVPIISNVLYNYKSEITRYEGSDSAICLTYNEVANKDIDTVPSNMKADSDYKWNDIKAVRDTQLSMSGLEFTFHPGLDFMSNFHFRIEPTNFKTVCRADVNPPKITYGKNEEDMPFNTMWDEMREYNGENVEDYDEYSNREIGNIHIFTAEEIIEPSAATETYIYENEGWYGFDNAARIRTYDKDNKSLEIQSPIADRAANDFIDLTPSRDLYTFYPKWNPYRKRCEKNWQYCITYPCSSTTDVSFIRSNTKSMKIASFDNIKNSAYIYFTSVAQHNFQEDEFVNIYSGDNLLITKAKIVNLGDGTDDEESKRFTFSIKRTEDIYDNWQYIDAFNDDEEDSRMSEILEDYPLLGTDEYMMQRTATYGGGAYYTVDGKVAYSSSSTSKDNPIPIWNSSYICPDFNDLDLSYKKVEGNCECEYYVRINAKYPNFSGASDVVNEYTVQNNTEDIIGKYSTGSTELYANENHQLAFAKTAYGDQMGSITYTEDISYDYMLDHRNIPVSDLFLTVFKNNRGYKEWYYDQVTTSSTVEYSHIFGKLTCAFELSKDSDILVDKDGVHLHKSIHTINNMEESDDNKGLGGMDISSLNGKYVGPRDDSDEINFEYNRYFYNDLIEYSVNDSKERIVQQCQFRFNTAQRELKRADLSNPKSYTGISFDTIVMDDYDGKFSAGTSDYFDSQYEAEEATEDKKRDLFSNKEGYFYNPHYRIPVRTVSASKTVSNSTVCTLRKDTSMMYDSKKQQLDTVLLVTTEDNYAELNTKVVFYCSNPKAFFYGKVVGIKNTYTCVVELYDDYELQQQVTGDKLRLLVQRIQTYPTKFKYGKPNTSNPEYADLTKDGSLDFQWREVLTNGFDDNDEEVYPFANESLYIDKKIVFFLRRQWCDRLDNVSIKFPCDHNGKTVAIGTFDEYAEEKDIKCLI